MPAAELFPTPNFAGLLSPMDAMKSIYLSKDGWVPPWGIRMANFTEIAQFTSGAGKYSDHSCGFTVEVYTPGPRRYKKQWYDEDGFYEFIPCEEETSSEHDYDKLYGKAYESGDHYERRRCLLLLPDHLTSLPVLFLERQFSNSLFAIIKSFENAEGKCAELTEEVKSVLKLDIPSFLEKITSSFTYNLCERVYKITESKVSDKSYTAQMAATYCHEVAGLVHNIENSPKKTNNYCLKPYFYPSEYYYNTDNCKSFRQVGENMWLGVLVRNIVSEQQTFNEHPGFTSQHMTRQLESFAVEAIPAPYCIDDFAGLEKLWTPLYPDNLVRRVTSTLADYYIRMLMKVSAPEVINRLNIKNYRTESNKRRAEKYWKILKAWDSSPKDLKKGQKKQYVVDELEEDGITPNVVPHAVLCRDIANHLREHLSVKYMTLKEWVDLAEKLIPDRATRVKGDIVKVALGWFLDSGAPPSKEVD